MMNSNFINNSVFKVKLNYEQMQNKTEELFFRCLDEERPVEYFAERIAEIWGNVDHSFMEDEIERYQEIIHERINGKEEEFVKNDNDIFGLTPIAVLIGVEKFFQKSKTKEYKNSYDYISGMKTNKVERKENYLGFKLGEYTNNTVVYRSHTEGGHDRMVSPSVYNSMIYNTNLVREGWNQTMYEADQMGAEHFMIPYHPFSCPHCIEYQEKLLTRDDIIEIAGRANTAKGDILHPNCACEISIWSTSLQIPRSKLTDAEKDEIYNIRQKVNGLTFKKEKIKTDMKVAKSLGNMKEYDKYNQRRNKINKKIRELKEELPNETLKKQVTAIYRKTDQQS